MVVATLDDLIWEYRCLNRVRKTTIEENVKEAQRLKCDTFFIDLYKKELAQLEENYTSAERLSDELFKKTLGES